MWGGGIQDIRHLITECTITKSIIHQLMSNVQKLEDRRSIKDTRKFMAHILHPNCGDTSSDDSGLNTSEVNTIDLHGEHFEHAYKQLCRMLHDEADLC